MDLNPDDFMQKNQASLDEQLLVKFFTKAKQDATETKVQGRPIFKDIEYIDIKVPGDRHTGVCRPARERDKARFPRHYKSYKDRIEGDYVEGTPLMEWAAITRSRAEELSYFNVKTVEQLANMSDVNAQNFMGINELKRKAKDWLEAINEGLGQAELQAELTKRDAQISTLQAQVAQLLKPKPAAKTRRKPAAKKPAAKKPAPQAKEA